MRMDFSSPTGEQQQNLNELLKACQLLVEVKRLNMADSAIVYGIDKIAAVIQKIEKVAA
jgi:hypothetical protein